MKLARTVAAAALVIGVASFNVHSASSPDTNHVPTSEAAQLQKEDFERADGIASALAPIRSTDDLARYLQVTPMVQSPLEKLTPGSRARFLASLTFNETGLTGFDYRDLVVELRAAEIYRILALFGAQRTIAAMRGLRVEGQLDKEIVAKMAANPVSEDYPSY